MTKKTIYLKDYQKPAFIVEQVELNFELYDDHALVTSQMQLQRQSEGPLHLYGDELELLGIKMNDQVLKPEHYELKEDDLYIHDCPDQFHLEVVTQIYPQENTKLEGLYRSNQLFCTQCEAEGFRRITFFPDRPDVLTTYNTRICADKKKYPVLLSNGNLIAQGDAENGRHWVIWQDPFKKPSYLFALVAGDLACVRDEFHTFSGRAVDLRIYVEPGNEDKCSHAMASLKKAMRWDEERYNREYDLDIFMIVAVSDFNMGAMENKGLNIFNSKYILARPDTATDQDFADIEGVVAHEYFHNWTGNRVTCRDWFQLSLKEGLTVFRDQEFSRDMNSREVNRIQDVKALLTTQFPEDAGSMAHPVRPESYQEINNFYTATVYNKGAEVIRMQHTLLGDEGFRKGMDLYFDRHDGEAVTIDDFVKAMEDANDVDFTQFKRWYSQAGTPVVKVQTNYEAGHLKINMQQSCPPTPENKEKLPFHIPIRIALFSPDGEKLPVENEVLQLKEAEQSFSFQHLGVKPIVSLLRDFSAPVKLEYPMNKEEKLGLLRYEVNGYAKWNAAQSLALECLHQWLNLPEEKWVISEDLLQAYRHVFLDDSYDRALRAELLTPPGFQEVIDPLREVDVTAVEKVRDAFRHQLGQFLFENALQIYEELWEKEDHGLYNEAYARRKFRNLCLWFMMKANEEESLSVCERQFNKAGIMSDQMASFTLLLNSQKADREKIRQDFYQQWKQNELVLDKWFAVQASSELPSTLERVKELIHHPDFNLKNPNKVRALIGTFCMANPRNFHALDGSGYDFLKDILITLDKINPQVAARLATPFTRWQQFDKPRQKMMKKQLKQLSSVELSNDLTEMVEKSLM
ncbi:aminopeptidase N [Legionella israelensis]|uniref:aminopeptidase N n=1 Tax=Legionella israelensis TaxID=454 RepID=UPI00117FEC6D|nr:aminopeptidase N [Legionella israelensis]QDP71246.1 aminopeptidase N [Legionella israelensis]